MIGALQGPFASLGTTLSAGGPSFGGTAPKAIALGGGQGSFAATLADLATQTVGTMRNAEATSVQALHGKADTREVVDAVMGAEQAFQTAVAIRDKIVTAYLEVSRMAI